MKHIREVLTEFPATARSEPSTVSNGDQRPSERLKTNCFECGQEISYTISFSRDGTRHGINPSRCSRCSQANRHAVQLKELEDGLPAECQKQKNKWLADLDLPGIFKSKAAEGFEKFQKELQPAAFEIVKSFDGRSIILSSPDLFGVGKTHLVCVLAYHLLTCTQAVTIDKLQLVYQRHFSPVQFITESGLLDRIRATYNRRDGGETEEEIYKRLTRYGLLIIDDVGKIRPHDLSFLQGVYFRIIDQRYTSRQSVILTTNLSLGELEKHIGGACADRLKEMCGTHNIVKMTGQSYRGRKTV